MLLFVIKSILVSALLFGTYKVLKPFIVHRRLNRLGMLLLMPISMIVVGVGEWIGSGNSDSTDWFVITVPEVYLDPITISSEAMTAQVMPPILWVWFVGVILFFGLFLWRCYKLNETIKAIAEWKEIGNFQVAYSERKEAFSFWNRIHIPKKYQGNEIILRHEMLHCEKKHTLDIMIMELQKVLFWFNPMIFFVTREVKLIHEYEVDEAIQHDVGKSTYVNALLNLHFGTSSIQFIQLFNNKKSLNMRITNLKRSKSTGLKGYKLATLLGAVCLGILLSSFSFDGSSLFVDLDASSSTNQSDGEVDKQPEFKGGKDALISYMIGEVKYPESAKKSGIEGKVFVEFTVSKKGKIKDAKVVKGADPALDEEALRVVSEMPDWSPGEKDGKTVDVKMTLPIAFKL